MNHFYQHEHERDPRLSRRGLRAWTLWVLAGAAGGAVGGGTLYILEIFSLTLLFGVTLGVAQALVIRRYLPGGAALLWAFFSSFGWPVGWFFLGLAIFFLNMAGRGFDTQAGSSSFAGVPVSGAGLLMSPVVFAVFGAFQAVVLLALLGRTFLPLAALWVAASALAGVLAPLGGLAVVVVGAETSVGGVGGGFVNSVLGPAVVTSAVFALYGTVTGVVLAMIARRTAAQGDDA